MSDDERANVPPDQRAGGNNDIPMSFSHSKPLPEIPMSRTEIEAYEVELKAELEQNVSKLNSKPLGELIYASEFINESKSKVCLLIIFNYFRRGWYSG